MFVQIDDLVERRPYITIRIIDLVLDPRPRQAQLVDTTRVPRRRHAVILDRQLLACAVQRNNILDSGGDRYHIDMYENRRAAL